MAKRKTNDALAGLSKEKRREAQRKSVESRYRNSAEKNRFGKCTEAAKVAYKDIMAYGDKIWLKQLQVRTYETGKGYIYITKKYYTRRPIKEEEAIIFNY